MKIAQRQLIRYCEEHSTPPDPILYELERETHLKTLAPQMMSGHLQGALLTLISELKQPENILEIGTFTGYATLCLVKGLQAGGTLHTIEANPEMAYIIDTFIKKAGREDDIKTHTGDAAAIVPSLDMTFDLVFIDAGKQAYAHHYDLIIDKVNPRGLILADNVLWSGKVVQKEKDADTQVLDAFNKKIQEDPRVKNLILPIRDGLTVIQKL